MTTTERPQGGGAMGSMGGWPAPRVWFLLGCLALLLLQGWWLAQNQTIVGNDAGSHLVRSLEVHEALAQPSRAALQRIWEVSEHRPPFSYLFTVPFYWLLGLSYDAALWSNVLWWLLTGVMVYGVGARLGDEWDGLWGGLLALTVPILFQLSRLYYQETLVAFLLWLSLLALLRAEGFARRRASLLFGVAVGLGLLVKWTLPTFLLAPMLWLGWRHRTAWAAWPRPSRGTLLGSVAGGLAFGALWAWLVAPMVGGGALVWLLGGFWSLLAAVALLTSRGEQTRLSNLVLAGSVALLVASLWYLPRLDFAAQFNSLVFGDAGRPEEMAPFNPLAPATWGYYLASLARDQWGLVAMLLLAAALPGLWRVRDRAGVRLVTLAVGGAWLIFTLSPFRDHARGLSPIVPALGLLATIGLRRWPRPALGSLLLALLVGWQVGQFILLTLPAGEALAHPGQRAGLLVTGAYQYWPSSGVSDRAYAVAPALLEYLRAQPGEDGRVFVSLLVNDRSLHQNTLRAEFEMLAPDLVRVVPLTKESADPYAELFRTPFVLYRLGEPTDATPEALATIERIERDPSGLFQAAFESVWERETPTGTLVLARRRHALSPLSVQERYRPLVETLAPLLTPRDVALVSNEAQVNALGAFGWPDTPLFVPTAAQQMILEAGLQAYIQPGQRLFAILWNPDPALEPMLEASLVRGPDWWFGDTHLIAYVAPTNQPARTLSDLGRLGSTPLETVAIEQATPEPGGALLLTLAWLPTEGEPIPYRSVVELYNAEGTLLAHRDLPPGDPWPADSPQSQRVALLLPRELGPAPYCLVIARYDPATGTRLRTPDGADHLALCL